MVFSVEFTRRIWVSLQFHFHGTPMVTFRFFVEFVKRVLDFFKLDAHRVKKNGNMILSNSNLHSRCGEDSSALWLRQECHHTSQS